MINSLIDGVAMKVASIELIELLESLPLGCQLTTEIVKLRFLLTVVRETSHLELLFLEVS